MKKSDIDRIIQKLHNKNLTVAFAESCTAGKLATEFVKGQGSSKVFLGSIVTYNEQVKQQLLGVKKKTLQLYTAESQQVTNEMVMGLHKHLGADFSIAVTGLTDHGGSENENKPKGTIFFSVYFKSRIDEFREEFNGSEHAIQKQVTAFIFNKIEEIYDQHFA